MKYFYSLHTGEVIKTDDPADWMGQTDIAAPAFDAQTQGAFFSGGAWELRQSAVPDAKAETVKRLAALDAENTLTQRNLRDFILLATAAFKAGQPVDLTAIPGIANVASIEAQAAALRALL